MRKPGLLAGALVALMVPLSAPHAEVAVKDYARKGDYELVKLSPDGRTLAVTRPYRDRNAIAFIDVEGMNVVGQTAFRGGDRIHRFEWTAPGRVVLEMATSGGPLDQPRLTGELVALDADGKGMTYLIGARGRGPFANDTRLRKPNQVFGLAFLVDTLRLDEAHILALLWDYDRIERDPFLVRINTSDATRKSLGIVPGYRPLSVVADETGQARFGVAHDRRGECVLLTAEPGKAWTTSRCSTGGGHRLVAAHGQTVYYVADDGARPACLREHVFAGATARAPICHDRVDASAVQLGFSEPRPIAVVFEDGRPQLVLPDPAHPDAQLLLMLHKTFKDHRIRVTSHTDDGSRVVVLVESDRNPGDFYLVDHRTRKVHHLLSRRAWIDPARMQPVEPIRYATRDGARIDGYLTARAGLATKGAPLVLLPHGGPHGVRDYWEWDAWAQLLAGRGYAVLQVNYRGSGGYGRAHETAGYRRWATLMQDDLTDAVGWAVEQGLADRKRICIVGGSYGGYAALMSAMREPDLYRCAASYAGVYDLVTQVRDSYAANSVFGRSYLQRVLGADEAHLMEQSPVTHVARLKAPVLIAHGTQDRVVPFSQAKALRKVLEQLGKEHEWIEFADEEHGFWSDEHHETFLTALLAFLDRHIGATAPPPPPADGPGRPAS